MGAIDKFLQAMKEVILLSEEMRRFGQDVSDLSKDVRDIDRRLIRIEALADVAQGKRLPKK